jgi:hypothetical protein
MNVGTFQISYLSLNNGLESVAQRRISDEA